MAKGPIFIIRCIEEYYEYSSILGYVESEEDAKQIVDIRNLDVKKQNDVVDRAEEQQREERTKLWEEYGLDYAMDMYPVEGEWPEDKLKKFYELDNLIDEKYKNDQNYFHYYYTKLDHYGV